MVEAAAFSSAKKESIRVDQIGPWIAPACRGSTVGLSEVLKGEWQTTAFLDGTYTHAGGPVLREERQDALKS